MATTFKTMQDRVLKTIALKGDSDTRTEVKLYLNEAAREIWTAYAWRERVATAFFNTVAPYTTGTASFTNGSSAVTGSGTTFTNSMVGRKMALGYDFPWYAVGASGSSTSITLDREYVEDTASDQEYVIYQDTYELGDSDSLLSERVVLFKDSSSVPLRRLNAPDFFSGGGLPGTDGTPTCFRMVEDSGDGSPQIQLYPVPDDTYAVRYAYLKPYTEMSGDSDTCRIPENRVHIIITGALREAYRLNGEYTKAAHEERRFQQKLADAVSQHRRETPISSVLRPFDQALGGVYRQGAFYPDI